MPVGLIPPGMTRDEYNRYPLAERRRISAAERARVATASTLQEWELELLHGNAWTNLGTGINAAVTSMSGMGTAMSAATHTMSTTGYGMTVPPIPSATRHLLNLPTVEVSAPETFDTDFGELIEEEEEDTDAECPHCYSTVDRDTIRDDNCDECERTCENCGYEGSSYSGDWEYITYNGYVCSECVRYCEECGNHYAGEDECCPRSAYDRGIHDYGHLTDPHLWLGGPLPRNEAGKQIGFYTGVEVEVTAPDDADAEPVYVWAAKHLGSRDAIQCKEDGSVNGFEIVTMPMTPEFFESVNWESFMDMLNREYPLHGDEPYRHGIHVHIGRVAFKRDDVAIAAYCYLLSQGEHLERIARRAPYSYCEKVARPVSVSIVRNQPNSRQAQKLANQGVYGVRESAINLKPLNTIEIRAFKSTRKADELRNAVRVTYVAAEYIRSLRVGKAAISPKALHWSEFARWTAAHHPEAFASIAGIATKDSNAKATAGKTLVGAANRDH